jgi:hypothetical protein
MTTVREGNGELPRLRARMAWWHGRRNRAADGPGDRRGAGLRFAFYGRVSTEDWQDPVTSRARQRGPSPAGAGSGSG